MEEITDTEKLDMFEGLPDGYFEDSYDNGHLRRKGIVTELLIASLCIASCVLIAACSPALNEDAASETASAHFNASKVE